MYKIKILRRAEFVVVIFNPATQQDLELNSFQLLSDAVEYANELSELLILPQPLVINPFA
jgi:hypothetical protein